MVPPASAAPASVASAAGGAVPSAFGGASAAAAPSLASAFASAFASAILVAMCGRKWPAYRDWSSGRCQSAGVTRPRQVAAPQWHL